MKNLKFLAVFLLFIGFTVPKIDVAPNLAEVDQYQGLYIFVKSKPIKNYEVLGTVKCGIWVKDEFERMIEKQVEAAKEEYPSANAILLEGQIKDATTTKATVIRIEE